MEDRGSQIRKRGGRLSAFRSSIFYPLSSIFLLITAGCLCHKPAPKPLYTGPTESLAAITEQINQNNHRIMTLWASGSFECWVRDDKKKIQHFDGDNLLLAFRKPADLRLAGEKFGVGRLFDIGSNDNQFWMWIPFDQVNKMWWGEYRNIANLNSAAIPIRPDLLIEVLGIGEFNSDLLRQPIPAMRFSNEEDAYLLTFHLIGQDHMIVQKEIWYDRATLLPRRVNFFDPDGRVVLRADLSEHHNIDADPAAPKIATHYDLNFLQTGTRMILNFHEVKTSNKGVPNDKIFKFPGPDAAGTSYRVDQPAPQ